MTEADLDMLHDWLNRPHIVEWWGGEEARPSLEEVRLHYLPRVLAEEAVTPYIAMIGTEPIGFAQSYIPMRSGDGWWEEETDPGVRGIDQSLANPTDLNKGLGTALVRALVRQLFTDPAVTKIQTDPAPENHRAIRCYEKAGFVQRGRVTTPDGPAIYMVQTRQAYEAARGLARTFGVNGEDLTVIKSHCHCGSVQLVAAEPPESLTECNCSICRRLGAQWAYYKHRQIRVDAEPGALKAYVWGDRLIEFYHCTRCGCPTHYESVEKGPESRVAINARMMDPKQVADLRVRVFDGAGSWGYIDEQLAD